jgi:hypothetical protein
MTASLWFGGGTSVALSLAQPAMTFPLEDSIHVEKSAGSGQVSKKKNDFYGKADSINVVVPKIGR